MKLLVLDNWESFSLVPYLKTRLDGHEVVKMANLYTDKMWRIYRRVDPDVVFVDFCDKNAVVLTNMIHTLARKPRIVVRLHRYEAHSALVSQVKWDNVDALVVVSQRYKEIVESKVSYPNIHVVHNGIDLDKFKLQDSAEPNTVAYCGYFNQKKGVALLRTLMASMPDRQFHLAGKIQDETVGQYMATIDLDNVTRHGWVKTEDFLKGKQFVISTSTTESFGMSLAEGMAMGLTPLVHAWPGAEHLWPIQCIWRSFDELKAIEPQEPACCRSWIEERYSMERCLDGIVKLLEVG